MSDHPQLDFFHARLNALERDVIHRERALEKRATLEPL